MRGKRRQAGGIVAGIAIAILVLLGLLIAGAVLLVHNIRVEESVSQGRKTVRIETPVGSMRLREQTRLDPKQLGLPVYPGATATSRPGKAVNLEFDFGGSEKHFDVAATEYSTTDPPEKVIEFYRKDLPQWVFTARHDGSVEIKYSEKGCQRIIAIQEEGGRTRITLAQAGEGQVN
ncbi:MAG: hypothetical protein ABSE56_11640 [Bryobacteraceae bacterium]|jgi:hypothetical protein